ncbi:MAG: aminotransferase class I/II-fold pyridoxal phosphate-dependent enzyme [Candidatus Diapherotrites archaeon]|uniref:Aminotransferase class I/II-fold pyridoxal phosphate-dependent enzyme n=1 Tax=Candidatus Iainarchaeum sp. TaxID=3101447 RepID=A0A938YUU2_9ARCH|nr:aminotransferase class I/II-fold pyridoxal phosphate-dependent enzyme [Candidatus Diapherotrites archaeon]
MAFKVPINSGLARILGKPYPFDAVDAAKEKAIAKHGREFIIDFGIGDPSDETPALVREQCKKAVDGRKTSGYPESTGSDGFKEAVCSWMKTRSNVSLERDGVVATYGAKYACFHVPLYYLNPGKGEIALIPNPGYPPYTDGTILAGAVPHYMNLLPENNFLPRFDLIGRETAEKVKILFLNNPHSPTGQMYAREKLKEAVDFCNDNGIILVSDECYNELFFGERPLSILEIPNAGQCSIVLNSLSKRSMMTGYAVGFAASKNPELLKPFDSVSRKSVQGVATFIQDAAVAAWNDERHPEQMRAEYSARIDALLPALGHAGCAVEKPAGTFYLWAQVPDGNTPLEFSKQLLLQKGINTVPGRLISHTFEGKNPGDKFVRFAMVQSVEKTKEAAERLLE